MFIVLLLSTFFVFRGVPALSCKLWIPDVKLKADTSAHSHLTCPMKHIQNQNQPNNTVRNRMCVSTSESSAFSIFLCSPNSQWGMCRRPWVGVCRACEWRSYSACLHPRYSECLPRGGEEVCVDRPGCVCVWLPSYNSLLLSVRISSAASREV